MSHSAVRVAVCTLLAFTAPLSGQSPCAAAFDDSLARQELAALDRVAEIPPVWDTYTLKRHALLLVADTSHHGSAATPVCAAIWRYGQDPQVVELANRPRLSTPLYGMIALDSAGPNPSASDAAVTAARLLPKPDLAQILGSQHIDRLVVLPFPLNFDRLGAFGAAMRSIGARSALLQADFAVHEGFHLHVQFPEWFDQPGDYAWTTWDRQPDRVQLRERCYAGSTAVMDAMQREHAALLAAFDALDSLVTPAGRRAVLSHASRFMELRAERYRLLDTVRVEMDGRPVSCAAAEDVMELQEGTTQWVGHATTVRAGLVTRTGKRGSYAGLQPEAFYQFGPLQLWVLDGLLSDDAMRDLTAALARSPGATASGATVFATFREVVTEEGIAPSAAIRPSALARHNEAAATPPT